jgi:hypothetical protein
MLLEIKCVPVCQHGLGHNATNVRKCALNLTTTKFEAKSARFNLSFEKKLSPFGTGSNITANATLTNGEFSICIWIAAKAQEKPPVGADRNALIEYMSLMSLINFK